MKRSVDVRRNKDSALTLELTTRLRVITHLGKHRVLNILCTVEIFQQLLHQHYVSRFQNLLGSAEVRALQDYLNDIRKIYR
jgi:hypothetical protein